MAKYEIKSYVDKKINYDMHSNDLTEAFQDLNYGIWFNRFKDKGITTEISEVNYGVKKRLIKVQSKDIESIIEHIKYKIFKLPKPKAIKVPGCSNSSNKLWTREETDIIVSYNPDLTHKLEYLEELSLYLPDRTIGSISERVKILRAQANENIDLEDLHKAKSIFTVEDENRLFELIKDEKYPLSYKLTSKLTKAFPDKSYHNIRSKIRQLLGRP